MATKIKLDQGIYLTPLNSESLLEIQDNLEARCFMCREILTNENKTVEHIYPKWLQKHCGLWDQKITLPNGSTMPYRQYTVPCCKDCNGTVMADFENQIRSTILQGYNSFKGLNEEIIAWWLYKLYYAKLVKQLIIDASGPYIENKIINATQIRPFNLKELYDLMKNVLQLRGVTDEIPEYVEGKMFSFIPRKV